MDAATQQKALTWLQYIPTCPESWGVHELQAPSLACARAGQWVQRLSGLQTNWHREAWKISCGGKQISIPELTSALNSCEALEFQDTDHINPALRKAEFAKPKCIQNGKNVLFRVHFFTASFTPFGGLLPSTTTHFPIMVQCREKVAGRH